MTDKIRTGVLALVVLVAGLGAVAGPASASDTFADGDESIAVVVDWDDTTVSDGDAATLTVNNTANTNSETVDVTVRDATGTETTYWVDYADLSTVSPAATDTVAVTASSGTVSVDESVAYDGASTIEISDGEGIETSVDVDENSSAVPVDVDLVVIDEDGTTVLNSTTAGSLNGSSTAYDDFHPSLSTNTSNVTVQVDHVTDGTNPQFDAVTNFAADRITVGIFGGGGGSSSMLLIGAGLVGAYVLLRG